MVIIVNNTVSISSTLIEAENVQQEEEGGKPETGIRTPTGRRGKTQTGKQDEVTEEPGKQRAKSFTENNNHIFK